MKSITLYALNEYVKRVIALNFQDAIWLQCEISHVAIRRGHMYLDLIEKDLSSNDIIAQSRATIWERNLRQLNERYGSMFYEVMSEGAEVNVCVKVSFHERYGLSLQIEDIDPSFTIGRLALQRKITIDKLKAAGVYDLQQGLDLPAVIQNIAVISSESAAGYIDFVAHLKENNEQYYFKMDIYPVAMQGVNAAREIMEQLAVIGSNVQTNYDAIVIVRGGGSRIDLMAFDDFDLCRSIASIKIPVIAGIGHEIDRSVMDEISCISLKTPTAVAEFLLERCRNFEKSIREVFAAIARICNHLQQLEATKIKNTHQHIFLLSKYYVLDAFKEISRIQLAIDEKSVHLLSAEQLKLQHFSRLVESNRPESILKRGFTMTRQNGKNIGRLEETNTRDSLETVFFDGTLNSKVI